MVDGLFFLLPLLLAITGEFTRVQKILFSLKTDGIEDLIFTLLLMLDYFVLSVLC